MIFNVAEGLQRSNSQNFNLSPVTPHPERSLCHFPHRRHRHKLTHTRTWQHCCCHCQKALQPLKDPPTSCLKITESLTLNWSQFLIISSLLRSSMCVTISCTACKRLCSWAGSGFETCGFISYSVDSVLDRFLFFVLPITEIAKRIPGSDAEPLWIRL